MSGSRTVTSLFRFFAVASFTVLASSLPVRADLLLHYDFNDDADPGIVLDMSGNGNDAEVLGAKYTGNRRGWTGADGWKRSA